MSLSMSLDDRPDDLPRTLRNPSLRTSSEPIQTRASAPPPGAVPQAVVTDIKIPFWRLVVFSFKLALAALPAIILLAFVLHGLTELVVRVFPDFRIWNNHLDYGPRSAPSVPGTAKPRQ